MASKLVAWQKKSKTLYANKIKVLSPAKLNLYLNILGRYSRRFNRIESVVERISLCDEIVIVPIPDKKIIITCNRRELIGDDNLCVRAAKLVQNKFRLSHGFKIALTKKIPVGAGLGGGSSNAASTLIAINEMLGLNIDRAGFYKLGAKLGSDVNFFLSESSYAVMTGRGEKIMPFEGKKMKHYMVYPGVHLATGLVYQHTHLKLTKLLNNVTMLVNALKAGNTALAERVSFNALEKSALSLCGEIQKVKDYFIRKRLQFRVTGSGSALYAFLSGNKYFFSPKDRIPKKWRMFAVSTF